MRQQPRLYKQNMYLCSHCITWRTTPYSKLHAYVTMTYDCPTTLTLKVKEEYNLSLEFLYPYKKSQDVLIIQSPYWAMRTGINVYIEKFNLYFK